jgi:hypothetical protein
MRQKESQLDDIREIRSIMEKSSRFLSLSGLSGVLAGFVGTGAALAADAVLDSGRDEPSKVLWIGGIGLSAMLLAVAASVLLSIRLARKRGQTAWGPPARDVVREMATPLVAGGLFCLVLVMHRMYVAVPGSLLVFYGLALAAAGKSTREEVRWLGWVEIALGMLAFTYTQFALLYWAAGFGIVHILYGGLMYFKYEL